METAIGREEWVACEAHSGWHREATDCVWPHLLAPTGPCPVIFDESGSLIDG